MAKRGKKYQEALKLVDRSKKYPIAEAVELLKKTSYAKFDATVEIAFKLNIDPRKAEQNLRGAISLPNGTVRVVRVLVIAKDAKAKEALAAGSDYAGDVEYLEKIKA
jgi:large subunit ribosomal protein L1